MSEIRYNRLEDRYVLIAPERLRRPDFMAWTKDELESVRCPFCEGNEGLTPDEIYAQRLDRSFADEIGWTTRVVPNRFKAVQIEAPYEVRHHGSHEVWEGFGAHEIIIDTPRHLTQISQWDQAFFYDWFKTLQARFADLKQEQRLAYIALFKNHGPFAGATQPHPHTQLVGLPVVPQDVARRYERAYHYYMESGHNIVDEMLHEEMEDGRRIILQERDVVAFCPFASEYPFEVVIAATRHFATVESLDEQAVADLSHLLAQLFAKMERQLGNFDFNMSIATPPLQNALNAHPNANAMASICRFYIRIMPRFYRQGGLELSAGMMINPVTPEHSARLLRESSEEK